MKKILTVLLAVLMLLSTALFTEAASSNHAHPFLYQVGTSESSEHVWLTIPSATRDVFDQWLLSWSFWYCDECGVVMHVYYRENGKLKEDFLILEEDNTFQIIIHQPGAAQEDDRLKGYTLLPYSPDGLSVGSKWFDKESFKNDLKWNAALLKALDAPDAHNLTPAQLDSLVAQIDFYLSDNGTTVKYLYRDLVYEGNIFEKYVKTVDPNVFNEAIDVSSGISMVYDKTVFTDPVTLHVSNVENTGNYFLTNYDKIVAWDIKILQNGGAVQPNGSVEVSIPVPAGFDESSIAVYHVRVDGTSEKLTSVIVDGNIVFTATSFSVYIVVDESSEVMNHTHDYTFSVTVTTPATCKTEGVKTFTCSCGDSYTERIAIDSNAHGEPDVNGNCPLCGKHMKDVEKPNDSSEKELNFFQRIIQWFRVLFAKLFGKKS